MRLIIVACFEISMICLLIFTLIRGVPLRSKPLPPHPADHLVTLIAAPSFILGFILLVVYELR